MSHRMIDITAPSADGAAPIVRPPTELAEARDRRADDCPAVVAPPIAAGPADDLAWIDAETIDAPKTQSRP